MGIVDELHILISSCEQRPVHKLLRFKVTKNKSFALRLDVIFIIVEIKPELIPLIKFIHTIQNLRLNWVKQLLMQLDLGNFDLNEAPVGLFHPIVE